MCFFFIGAGICLGMSAIYYILPNHSPRVNNLSKNLDLLALFVLLRLLAVTLALHGIWLYRLAVVNTRIASIPCLLLMYILCASVFASNIHQEYILDYSLQYKDTIPRNRKYCGLGYMTSGIIPTDFPLLVVWSDCSFRGFETFIQL